jgi:1,2-diacylglycerol 3-beta-glucosyltransferase
MYASQLWRSTVANGLSRRGLVTADLLIDLVVPPLGQLVAGLAGLLGGSVVIGIITGQMLSATWIAGIGLSGAVVYVLAGWARSHTGFRGLRDLAFAPGYVAWKLLGNRGGSKPPKEWVRTPRAGEIDRTPEVAPVTVE